MNKLNSGFEGKKVIQIGKQRNKSIKIDDWENQSLLIIKRTVSSMSEIEIDNETKEDKEMVLSN